MTWLYLRLFNDAFAEYSYDAEGRLIEYLSDFQPDDSMDLRESYEYENGRLVKYTFDPRYRGFGVARQDVEARGGILV